MCAIYFYVKVSINNLVIISVLIFVFFIEDWKYFRLTDYRFTPICIALMLISIYINRISLNGRYEPDDKNSYLAKFGKELPFGLFYQFIRENKEYVYNEEMPHFSCLCEVCEN